MAAIWAELERRGEDLAALRSGLAVYLPLIAAGRLNAELVVRYAGQSMLLHQLVQLPSVVQSSLLADDHVTVVERVGDDFVESRQPVSQIDSRNLKYVFSDRILTAAEQRDRLRRRGPAKPPRNAVIIAARKSGLRGMIEPGQRKYTLNVVMTPDEFERMKVIARDNSVSVSALVRSAILDLIKEK